MIEWLLHMKFSFLDEMAHVFFKKGVNPHRAPYRRLLKLMDQGLVDTRKVYHDPRDLYVATHKSVRLLRSIGFQYVPALSKDKTFSHFDHDYTLIKLRIMAHDLKLGVWVPERVIRSIKPHGGCPDALLMTADANYAVEYEYSEKEMDRYKRIFDYYATQTNYDGVLYILRTEARIEKVREKIPYIDPKIYFICEENLFLDPQGAVFTSSTGELSMEDLLSYSLTCPLEAVEHKDLEEIILAGSKQSFFSPSGGGGGKHHDGDDAAPEEESSSNDSVDPDQEYEDNSGEQLDLA